MYKWSKHKKSIISAPGLARRVLSAFLACMYFDNFSWSGLIQTGIFDLSYNFRLFDRNFRNFRKFRYNFGPHFRTLVSLRFSVSFAKIFGLRKSGFYSGKVRNFRCRKFRLSVTPKLQNFFCFAVPYSTGPHKFARYNREFVITEFDCSRKFKLFYSSD